MKNKKCKTYRTRLYEENSKEIADKLWAEYVSKISQNLNSFIRRYGNEEGKKRYKIFIDRSKHTKEQYIKKYGQEEGKQKWKSYIQKKKETSKRSLAYWLIKFDGDYDLAKLACSDYQRRDKKFFIKKYGQEEGKQKWKEKREKQSKTMKKYFENEENRLKHAVTIKKCIEKYGKIIGEQKYKEWLLKTSPGTVWKNSTTSNVSQDFCQTLESNIADALKKYIKYATKNDEWWLYDNNTKNYFFYDFAIVKSDNKKIIEFNGDFWHANPKIYTEGWIHPVINYNAKKIWERDDYKLKLATKKGFNILTIWEKDWRNNKKEVINKCINFIKNKEI